MPNEDKAVTESPTAEQWAASLFLMFEADTPKLEAILDEIRSMRAKLVLADALRDAAEATAEWYSTETKALAAAVEKGDTNAIGATIATLRLDNGRRATILKTALAAYDAGKGGDHE